MFNKNIQGFNNPLIEMQIFTDGSCWPNPSRFGGWAYVLREKGVASDLINSGSSTEEVTTNNRMELMAVIQAFKAIKRSGVVIELVTDSEYVGKGIAFWMHQWQRTNWRVKNGDLWKELYGLVNLHTVYVTCIPGHNGQPENEQCDRLAEEARGRMKDV